jgi:uncharacterized membrane protein YkvA (DUF1232 family)
MFGRLGALLMLRRTVPLAWRLLKDGRVPFTSKLIIPGGLLYTVFPLDLMPDFIPGLGQLDDLTIIVLALTMFVRSAPKEVVQEHIERMAGRYRPAAEPSSKGSGKVVDGEYEVLD